MEGAVRTHPSADDDVNAVGERVGRDAAIDRPESMWLPSVTWNAYSLPPGSRLIEPGTTRAPTFTPAFENAGSACILAVNSVGVR